MRTLDNCQLTEKQYNACVKGKFIVQMLLIAVAVLAFLFSDFIVFYYKSEMYELSGADVLSSIFYGGSVPLLFYNVELELLLPAIPLILSVLCTVVPLGCAVFSSIVTFKQNKDNKISAYVLLAFSAILLFFYILLLTAKGVKAVDPDGNEKIFYQIYEVKATYLVVALLLALAGLIQLFLKPEKIENVKRYAFFYCVLIIPTLLILVFNVYPSVLQTILAFKDYLLANGIWGSAWNGLDNFKFMFTDPQMLMVIWQTIYLSLLRLVAGIVPPVFFALVFYHINGKVYKNVVQTIVYIPHFFSWVVIYAILSNFFLPNGLVNNIIVNVFGGERIDFLSRQDLFYPNMIFSSIWKEVGWGTILFTASLMGIDKSLYEAAAIDGAGVFAKLRKITLPALVPILVYQIVMSVGNILKGAGGEQILIFATSAVKVNKALVIDTWLYWEGLGGIKYGLSAAVSFIQAVIGFFMVVGAHLLSKKLVGIGAW